MDTDELHFISCFSASQQTVADDNGSLCGVGPEMLVGGMQEL